jgi:poly-beta-1,6-N-acetyl-D-glucosamine synthase
MDPVMTVGVGIFGVLFGFIAFIALLVLISVIRPRQRWKKHLPRVTVIIPCYNEERHVAACIKSVLKADYPKPLREILVSDDGSTDNTASIAKKLGVQVLKGKHVGKVDTLNRALKAAKGEIIVTVDADTTVEKDFLRRIVEPFSDERVGAVSGPALVANHKGLLGLFQEVEYHYNNMVRYAFSVLFDTDVWFFGCLAAYRKSVLEDIGGFSKDTMTEDMDVVLRIRRAGHRTIHVPQAKGYTEVPTTLRSLGKQRARWWGGGFQLLGQNRDVFWRKKNGIFRFIFMHHAWWAFYALVSLPLIIYQVWFWLPQGSLEITYYLLRWFTLAGPIYVLYMIPAGWLSWYNVFGVSAGLLNAALLLGAMRLYRSRIGARHLLAVFLYFPYTIALNMFVLAGLITAATRRKAHFIAT